MTSEELQQIAETNVAERKEYDYELNVCMALGCMSQHSDRIKASLAEEVARTGKRCHVRQTGCLGPCAAGPLVQVGPTGPLYGGVQESDAEAIVDSLGNRPVGRLETHLEKYFAGQHPIVLENSGQIDPEKIDEFIGRGGYLALMHVLTQMDPQSVIEQISRSGLRGRGGGGYPTGLKWSTVSKAVGAQKYVICNGDEGDPGAFMDRSVLESNPQRVIEGMAIAAYAVGATKGYIYVRAEYPLAISRLTVSPARGPPPRLPGQQHLRHHLRLRHRDSHRRRRLRLRRGDRADRLHRGHARPAPPPPALSRRLRAVGLAHPHQQRRDLRQHAPHPPQRAGVVSPAWAPTRARAPRSSP